MPPASDRPQRVTLPTLQILAAFMADLSRDDWYGRALSVHTGLGSGTVLQCLYRLENWGGRDARIRAWARCMAGKVGVRFGRQIRRDASQAESSLWSLSSWSPDLQCSQSEAGLSTTSLSTLMATAWPVKCIQRVVRWSQLRRLAPGTAQATSAG